MTLCPECHHRPSGRFQEYGAECHCPCHNVADLSLALLAACNGMLDALDGSHAQVMYAAGKMREAVAQAEPPKS